MIADPSTTVGEGMDVFAHPDLTTFCRLDELGLVVTGQRLEPERAVLACRVVEPDRWCHRCGCEGTPTVKSRFSCRHGGVARATAYAPPPFGGL